MQSKYLFVIHKRCSYLFEIESISCLYLGGLLRLFCCSSTCQNYIYQQFPGQIRSCKEFQETRQLLIYFQLYPVKYHLYKYLADSGDIFKQIN